MLDGPRKPPLMSGTGSGDAAREDFPSLGDKLLEPRHIFVIDRLELFDAKPADPLAEKGLPLVFIPIAPLSSLACFAVPFDVRHFNEHATYGGPQADISRCAN